MHIISNIALITINETLFIQLLSFLFFMFIMNRIMFRPLHNVMDERENHINGIKLDTDNTLKELDSLTVELQKKESEVRAESFDLKKNIEESGSLEAAEIFADARREIETIKKDTETKINVQITEAKKYLHKESEILAMSIMEKLLDRRLVQ